VLIEMPGGALLVFDIPAGAANGTSRHQDSQIGTGSDCNQWPVTDETVSYEGEMPDDSFELMGIVMPNAPDRFSGEKTVIVSGMPPREYTITYSFMR
jgi:hypothetical protein